MEIATATSRVSAPRFMEHRWGVRIDMDLPVRLENAGQLVAQGRLENASISGGFVAANATLPPLATVDVVVRMPGGHLTLPACVVRRSQEGFGLEWRDMACDAVVKLLREADLRTPREFRRRG